MLEEPYYDISTIYNKDFCIIYKKIYIQNFFFQSFKRVYESMKRSLYSPVAASAEPASHDILIVT